MHSQFSSVIACYVSVARILSLFLLWTVALVSRVFLVFFVMDCSVSISPHSQFSSVIDCSVSVSRILNFSCIGLLR